MSEKGKTRCPMVSEQEKALGFQLVFESPVRSGLLPSRAWTETETGLRKSRYLKRPDRTAKDRSSVVGLGLFAVTRPVLTSYGLNRFITGLDRSSGVLCE